MDETGSWDKPPPAGSRNPDRSDTIHVILRFSNDPVLLLDPPTDTIIDGNHEACELLGYSYDELVSTPISSVLPDAMPEFLEFTTAVTTEGTGWADMFPCYTKAGEVIPSEISAVGIEVNDAMDVLVYVRALNPTILTAEDVGTIDLPDEAIRTLETLVRTHEHELRRLRRINRIIRECQQRLLKATTRSDIEQEVCNCLTGVDRYVFAWIGIHDRAMNTVSPRTWSDADTDFFSDLIIPVDEPPTHWGPLTRAARTGEVKVTQNLPADPAFADIREQSPISEFKSAAAVPLSYHGVTYGILAVYADKLHSFSQTEQDVLGELGELAGAAIVSLERKRALLSDSVVELEFETTDRNLVFVWLTDHLDCTFEYAASTQCSDGSLCVFGTVNLEPNGQLIALPELSPIITSLEVIAADAEGTLIKVGVSDTPIYEILADFGAVLHDLYADGGTARFTVELPASPNVRTIIDRICARYPETRLRAKHEYSWHERSTHALKHVLGGQLTDRQREVLERAYFRGYFEQPRRYDGGEIGASLGISQSAFNQTLRTAQNNIFRVMFDSVAE